MNKLNEWYLSDGWYSDGPEFALDYYTSYVIHPMYVEILEVCKAKKFLTPVSTVLAICRMQRFNVFIERLISPEGTYPAFGRSVTVSYTHLDVYKRQVQLRPSDFRRRHRGVPVRQHNILLRLP